MIIRSRTPLRLGLAGGGTDISPFLDNYGGCVLNSTINLFSYCTIIPRKDGKIIFNAPDRGARVELKSKPVLEINEELPLHCGVYNRIVKDFNKGKPLSFEMTTYSDAPAGSGLGTSSTMVVTIMKAFQEWLGFFITEYDFAQLAYDIERIDLGFSGGKQDQYAAVFGGTNFIEFYHDRTVVNPLKVKKWIIEELTASTFVYFTGRSRDSGKIIEEQIKSQKENKSLEAMFEVKEQATLMKEHLLKGEFDGIIQSLNKSWEAKKKTSSVISNERIEKALNFIMANGGKACKISGAGGGGFMMVICDPSKRYELVKRLNTETDGQAFPVEFVDKGTQGWTIYDEE